jgi:lysophospholipase L1-like esterase
MIRLMVRSVAIALVPFVLYFAFCSFLSSHPSAATQLSLEKWAKIAYYGRRSVFLTSCGRYDARLTYMLRPGRCRFAGVEYDTQVNVNSFGLRDDEESLARPEIIVLGDSNAMGHGVEDQEAFPQVLERMLGRKVLNAGIRSYGTARELMLLRLLDTSAARVIVIQYCNNDLEENEALLQHGTLPIQPQREYEALVQKSNASYMNLLGPGLRVLQKLGDRVSDKLRRMLGHERSPKRVDVNEVQAQAFHDVLARSSDLLRGRHIVILDVEGPGGNARFINAVQSRSADLGLDLSFADISTVVTPQDFFVLDAHMRPSGHEKVASLLARVIGDQLKAPGDDQNY